MQIIDIDAAEMKNAARRGRTRSPETQNLIDAIDSLTPNDAKAVVLEAGDTGPRIRSRLVYAARVSGKRLQIAIQDDRVLFGLSSRRRRRRTGT